MEAERPSRGEPGRGSTWGSSKRCFVCRANRKRGSAVRGGGKAPAGTTSAVEGAWSRSSSEGARARGEEPRGRVAALAGSNDDGGCPTTGDHESATRASGRAKRVLKVEGRATAFVMRMTGGAGEALG